MALPLAEALRPGDGHSDRVLAEAAARIRDVRFIAGDFMTLDFGGKQFDVIVTLEVLSHLADQQAFV
ncbi:MAG: methyltransferase domain-containing protein, partial [Caulobacteraceae bacterium]